MTSGPRIHRSRRVLPSPAIGTNPAVSSAAKRSRAAEAARCRRSADWFNFCWKIPRPMLYHNEPIYRDGERVGFVTSGMYGHTLGGAVALGYVAHARWMHRCSTF